MNWLFPSKDFLFFANLPASKNLPEEQTFWSNRRVLFIYRSTVICTLTWLVTCDLWPGICSCCLFKVFLRINWQLESPFYSRCVEKRLAATVINPLQMHYQVLLVTSKAVPIWTQVMTSAKGKLSWKLNPSTTRYLEWTIRIACMETINADMNYVKYETSKLCVFSKANTGHCQRTKQLWEYVCL